MGKHAQTSAGIDYPICFGILAILMQIAITNCSSSANSEEMPSKSWVLRWTLPISASTSPQICLLCECKLLPSISQLHVRKAAKFHSLPP